MGAHPQPQLTPEQYLDIERAAEYKSEYYRGEMFAMSGGSYDHARVAANLTGELHRALKNGPCVVASSDLRVSVSKTGLYTYPDAVVICGDPQFVDGRNDTLLNPKVVIEVLSPSTESYDRGFKSAQYRNIDSLEEYALVAQNEARVEIYRRQKSGGWLLNDYVGMDDTCHFGSLDCSLALADIYDKVTLEGPLIPPRPPTD